MLEKLKSRKFLMAAVSVCVGILTIFGVSESVVALVSGIALVLVPVVTYIAAEGRIDARAVSLTADALAEVSALIKDKAEEK